MNAWQNALRNRNWLDMAGLLALMAVTFFVFATYEPGNWLRWPALLVLLLFIPLLSLDDEPPFDPRREHLRLAIATALTIVLFLLQAHLGGIIVLYFIMSAHALIALPGRQGMFWVVLFGALTTLFMVQIYQDLWLGLANGIGVFAGYYFIGSAAHAQRRAEAAEAESQRLLDELRVTHLLLQAQAEHAEALAAAEERNRLAREVHDTLGHRLTVAAVQLEAAQRLVDREPARATAMIETVRGEVAAGLAELRQTVAALRRPQMSRPPLNQQLQQLSESFSAATGIPVDLVLSDVMPPLATAQQDGIYRIAQESLTNVQRHAAATHVTLELTETNDEPADQQICLIVADDGVGFDPAGANQGFGLRGMRERAALLNADWSVEADAGGTRVTLILPLTPMVTTPEAVS